MNKRKIVVVSIVAVIVIIIVIGLALAWNHFNDYHISGRRRRETADKR